MGNVGGLVHNERRLSGDMTETMAGMNGHLVVGCIGSRRPVKIHCNDRRRRTGNGRIAASAMDQRCQ